MATPPEPTSTTPISPSTTMPDNASTQEPSTSASTRPSTLTARHPSSGTIIVPREALPSTPPRIDYPPSDARAMSPRRDSAETDRITQDMREAQAHARSLQSGLVAIAEKIDTIKADHERLEKQNMALQDYIGGLTRSLSRTNAPEAGGKGRK